MTAELPSHFPAEVLEQRAAQQRERIQHSVDELKSSLRETIRQRLDVEGYLRHRIWRLVAVAAVLALAGGYGTAAIFSRR